MEQQLLMSNRLHLFLKVKYEDSSMYLSHTGFKLNSVQPKLVLRKSKGRPNLTFQDFFITQTFIPSINGLKIFHFCESQ